MENRQTKLGLIFGGGFLLLWVTVFAQTQKEKLNNGWEVSYTESSNDLNGPYSVTSGERAIIRGSFTDDRPKGNWFAFSKTEDVALRYNFDNNQVLQMDEKLITQAKIQVKSDDGEITEKARVSFPLISTDYYIDYLKDLVKHTIPSHVKESSLKIPAEVTATIDAEGNASYQAKYIVGNKELQPKLKIKEDALRINWIPAEYNNQKYASEFTVYFELTLEDAPDHKRVIWN